MDNEQKQFFSAIFGEDAVKKLFPSDEEILNEFMKNMSSNDENRDKRISNMIEDAFFKSMCLSTFMMIARFTGQNPQESVNTFIAAFVSTQNKYVNNTSKSDLNHFVEIISDTQVGQAYQNASEERKKEVYNMWVSSKLAVHQELMNEFVYKIKSEISRVIKENEG